MEPVRPSGVVHHGWCGSALVVSRSPLATAAHCWNGGLTVVGDVHVARC